MVEYLIGYLSDDDLAALRIISHPYYGERVSAMEKPDILAGILSLWRDRKNSSLIKDALHVSGWDYVSGVMRKHPSLTPDQAIDWFIQGQLAQALVIKEALLLN